MTEKVLVRPNAYYDSATLMSVAQKVKSEQGVDEAVAVMATEANKELLANVGMLSQEAGAATTRDLVLAVRGDSQEAIEAAFQMIEAELAGAKEEIAKEKAPRSLAEALEQKPDANLVVISVAGQFAAREARKALEAGLNVMLFSDNVPLEAEIELKTLAAEKGLLMMGPDCGTALIGGAPLAFANVVRRGKIGIVAAAGTGLQEVSTLIHRLGGGVSHGIGTGGRDVKASVGGRQLLFGIQALEADSATEVIVVTGKPPAPDVEVKLLDLIKTCKKPVIVNLLGGDAEATAAVGATFAPTLEEAAQLAVQATGLSGKLPIVGSGTPHIDFAPNQRWLRGLFTGGTLCYEAQLVLAKKLGPVYSNTPLKPELAADDFAGSRHIVLDLGDDQFTSGRPHPMIEPSIRGEWLTKVAADPEIAVVLMDFVLGYGAHREPVASIADEIQAAQTQAAERGGNLMIIASVTGTNEDPQILDRQVAELEALGVIVLPSNRRAVEQAALVLRNLEGRQN
ncbi:MAG: acyl-CoA synthetase FdrA [Firmicutes bacterium]|nr:acyl-CoA synthetase FdrA [Bacillota bacterium]